MKCDHIRLIVLASGGLGTGLRMDAPRQAVFALAFSQETLAGLAGPRILETIRRHTDNDECRPTELLGCDSLDSVCLGMNHAEGAATLDPIVTYGNNLAPLTYEGHMGVITPVFAGIAILIRQNGLLHIALDPSG